MNICPKCGKNKLRIYDEVMTEFNKPREYICTACGWSSVKEKEENKRKEQKR